MTQYPSPYSPPPYYPQTVYDPQHHLMQPARYASYMMFVLAALMCFCGVCIAGFSRVNPADLPVESRMQLDQVQRQIQSPIPIQTVMLVYGVLLLLPGTAMGVLGAFVRRGGFVSLVLSLIFAIALALFLAFSVISSLVVAGVQGLLGLLPLAALLLLIIWLIQALRARPQMSAMQSQYAAYYQHYMQAQHAYQQAYGYGAPPAQQQQQPQQQQPPPQSQPPPQGPSDAPPQG